MRRSVLTAVISLLSVALYSQAAFAGEWNKARGYIHGTADDPLPAASVCAFNGLDEPNDIGPDGSDDNLLWGTTPAGGIVQAYGQIVAVGLKGAFPAPGDSCKGAPNNAP
jgi:hypothetical protein